MSETIDRPNVVIHPPVAWKLAYCARARSRLLGALDARHLHHRGALETGAQLEDVQKAAGHRDPSITKLYYHAVTTQRRRRRSSRPTKREADGGRRIMLWRNRDSRQGRHDRSVGQYCPPLTRRGEP